MRMVIFKVAQQEDLHERFGEWVELFWLLEGEG